LEYLVLLDGCNFWIDGLDAGAWDTGKADFSRVALESAVHESCYLTIDVACFLCVGECTVCSSLLEAVEVL
jgi:hypothetical protein